MRATTLSGTEDILGFEWISGGLHQGVDPGVSADSPNVAGKAPWQENHLNMDMNGVDFWTFQVGDVSGCQWIGLLEKNKETLVWNPKYKHVRFQVSLSHLKVQNLDPNFSATHLACYSFGKWTIYRLFSYSNSDFP